MSNASREALEGAKIIMGPPRHLALLPDLTAKHIAWPVPFADGISQLIALRGQRVVILASGDPFWFGAGSVITRQLAPNEWRAFPGVTTFSLAASHLGWPLETTVCLGLHAAPMARLRPHLAPGARAVVLLRDGAAVQELTTWLDGLGFGATTLHVMEKLGGPHARLRTVLAAGFDIADITHPVCVGLDVAGDGNTLGLISGRADEIFETDGQITKRPMRALTLSALAPRHGDRLWDIGGGTGSIAIEWLLSHPSTTAITIEPRPDRAARIRRNADQLGVDRLQVITGLAPDCLTELPPPNAVFIGGGLSEVLLVWLHSHLPVGTRLVANAVTLESEALLAQWQARIGGELLRIELAQAGPLGSKRGWKSRHPVVQWSVVL